MTNGTHEGGGPGVRRSTPVLLALVMAGTVAAGPRAAQEAEKKAEDPMKAVTTVSSPVLPAAVASAAAPESTPAADTDVGEFASGMRVFKDPKTGRLREGEPEEIRALARKLAADRARAPRRVRAAQAALAGVTAPDGSVTMYLDESFMTEVVATKGPDGQIHIRHAGSARPQGEDRNDQ